MNPPQSGIVTVVVGRFGALIGLGLAAVLSGDRRLRVLANDLDTDLLERAVVKLAPRVIIINEASAQPLLDRLTIEQSALGIVILANDPPQPQGLLFLACGASCIPQSASRDEVLAAIHYASGGGRLFVAVDGSRIERRYPSDTPLLTERQIQVLRHFSLGHTHARTAFDLGISVRTVHTYTAQLCRKLHVRSSETSLGCQSHAPRNITRV